MAWATTAFVLLAENAPAAGHAALFLTGLCAAWKCCAGHRMLARRVVVALLAVALPVQGFAGIAPALRGPAHFHGADRGHVHVERHHHAAGEGAIEVDVEDDHHHAAPAGGDNKRTAFGSIDTLSAAVLVAPSQLDSAAVPAGRLAMLATPVPGRLERPPTPERD
jgi:hypothetical protein